LNSICKFLRTSGKFYFQNYNLALFVKFIKDDPVFDAMIEDLASKYLNTTKAAKELAEVGAINYTQGTKEQQLSLAQYRKYEIKSFEEWVVFCFSYVQNIGINCGNKVITNFVVNTGVKEDDENLSPKLQFYNDCIEPIRIYLKLQVEESLNATAILQRYKVLCEWYDRKDLISKREVPITKSHLSKFLFDEGYTYTLAETNVPSGRIDNFATTFGLKKNELYKLPSAIIAEGKLYTGNVNAIEEVNNQVQKRINELNFGEGYCVIFNKTDKEITLTGQDGKVNGLNYKISSSKRTFFVVINLHESFYDSKVTVESVEIDIN